MLSPSWEVGSVVRETFAARFFSLLIARLVIAISVVFIEVILEQSKWLLSFNQ